MDRKVVQIRITAGNEADALGAIAALTEVIGTAVTIGRPELGRKGQDWLAYGTFHFDDGAPESSEPAPPASTSPTRRPGSTQRRGGRGKA